MAQQRPERIDHILELVQELSAQEHEQLIEQMNLQWLRKALDEGEESSRLHETRPADEFLAELEATYERKKAAP